MSLALTEYRAPLLTHPLVSAGPIPTVLDPEGVYPYPSFCESSRRPVLAPHLFLALENDHLRVTICPSLGGRVFSMIEKSTGQDALFSAPIVRPVRFLPRLAFASGGIEVSFPVSHTPVQIEEIPSATHQTAERVTVWCGEREARHGLQWTVEYSLGIEDRFLTQRLALYNPTSRPHTFTSWSNAAVPADADTEFHFPAGRVLRHTTTVEEIDWRRDGPRTQGDLDRMGGFFWREPDVHAFGVFTPSRGIGLYHVADPHEVPGIKLWSYGMGRDERWSHASTLGRGAYVELQSGAVADQSQRGHLAPGEYRCTTEFWIPSARPLDIRTLPRPEVRLAPRGEIPRFEWTDDPRREGWCRTVAAHHAGDPSACPPPPSLGDDRWAPGGMDELGPALVWAAGASEGKEREGWRFQIAAWHAGRGELDTALHRLESCRDDRARALAARLHRGHRKDPARAAAVLCGIESEAFAHHPQVVVERDLALAALGPETRKERRAWLDRVGALEDEWLAERRAALALDEGRPAEARRILEDTRFQLVHQRYVRTELWARIAHALGEKDDPAPPPSLGEDDLAPWGAYREYDSEA